MFLAMVQPIIFADVLENATSF